jgi:hypothetical protein
MKQKSKAHFGIKINEGTNLHVNVGDLVNKGDKLISFLSSEIKVFNDPKLLKLSGEIWNQINQENSGKRLNKNDILYKKGGLFSTIINMPWDGVFLMVDEFGNIQVEIDSEKEKEITAPVRSVVAKIEDGKLTLEFDAVEFKGQGLIEGKAWGKTDLKIVDKIMDLNYEFEGQIILTRDINQTFLTKAEVVGVTALVTDNKEINLENMESNLPVLVLDGDEWNELFMFEGMNRDVLLNSKSGRLLMVIE